MNFNTLGVYEDKNMPNIDNYRALVMGIRISPSIDVSPAFNVIDEINSGIIGWFSRPIEGTEVRIFSSVNGGSTWDKMVNGQYLQNVEVLNDDPSLKLKYVIKSYISQLILEKSPKLFNVTLILFDKNRNFWKTEVEQDITFTDTDEQQLSWSEDEEPINWG